MVSTRRVVSAGIRILEHDRVREVELRELGPDLDANQRVTDDLRRERESNAEFLPLNRDRGHTGGAGLRDGRYLATGQEACRIIVLGDDPGLRENVYVTVLFLGLQERKKVRCTEVRQDRAEIGRDWN